MKVFYMYLKYSIDEEISDLAYQLTLPPAAFLDVQTARKIMSDFSKKTLEYLKDKGLLDTTGLTIREVAVTGYDGYLIKARIYTPSECAGSKCSGIVYFHGGGWISGDLDMDHYRLIRYSREAKVIVISVDYRLAPENPFPIPVEDCYNAVKWAYQNADLLNIDPNRLGVGGENSGANLAAAVSLMARDRREVKITYQLLLYPVLNLISSSDSAVKYSDTPVLNRALLQILVKLYLADNISNAYHPYASPLLAQDFKNLPITYLAIGQYDPGRDDSFEYVRKLLENDISVEFHIYANEPHGFDLIYPLSTISKRALEEQINVLKKFSRTYR
ncbi:MAG: alpha/beta hydrolase [Sulfolobaceae archaeon]|nr:alpha/beta hydrolase [Sulfolobaceae archaeon]